MYNLKTYLTIDIFNEILKEFEWPCSYKTEELAVDGLKLHFPKCTLIVDEEPMEGEIYAIFPNCYTGRTNMQGSLKLLDAVGVIREKKLKDPNYKDPVLHDLDIYPSLNKVEDGCRNICILIQTFLLSCVVEGDFSWIDDYKKEYPEAW